MRKASVIVFLLILCLSVSVSAEVVRGEFDLYVMDPDTGNKFRNSIFENCPVVLRLDLFKTDMNSERQRGGIFWMQGVCDDIPLDGVVILKIESRDGGKTLFPALHQYHGMTEYGYPQNNLWLRLYLVFFDERLSEGTYKVTVEPGTRIEDIVGNITPKTPEITVVKPKTDDDMKTIAFSKVAFYSGAICRWDMAENELLQAASTWSNDPKIIDALISFYRMISPRRALEYAKLSIAMRYRRLKDPSPRGSYTRHIFISSMMESNNISKEKAEEEFKEFVQAIWEEETTYDLPEWAKSPMFDSGLAK